MEKLMFMVEIWFYIVKDYILFVFRGIKKGGGAKNASS